MVLNQVLVLKDLLGAVWGPNLLKIDEPPHIYRNTSTTRTGGPDLLEPGRTRDSKEFGTERGCRFGPALTILGLFARLLFSAHFPPDKTSME